jgi:Tuberculosis necrotizing toxin
MRYRSLFTVAISVLVMCVAPAAISQAAACPAPQKPPLGGETKTYFQNNYDLGPDYLPTSGPVAKLLGANYSRFGPMSEDDWKQNFYTPGADGGQWSWPRISSGFNPKAGPPFGAPTEKKVPLPVGKLLDRFGGTSGQFLSPAGIPFGMRALPPSKLNTPADGPTANYHVYCVTQAFDVDAGPIYPWFAQPGNGRQFFLNPDYLGGKNTDTVQWLLDNGRLSEVAPQ